MPKILDGKVVRDEIMADLKQKISQLKVIPTLAIVMIGDNPDSAVYVKNKISFAQKIGAKAYVVEIGQAGEIITREKLLSEIEKLNKDKTVHGIIIQSPLPEPLDWAEAVEKVIPEKDVDGLCSVNVQKLLASDSSGFVPATAKGVLSLLNYYNLSPKGKKIAVMGRSALVGKPIASLLKNAGAEISVIHSQTLNPQAITREADILIVAIGKPEFVGADYMKEGQVVIDVGINSVITHRTVEGVSVTDRKIYGDVDFESVKDLVSAISPVPGGVGPMTVASLFQNLAEGVE